MESQISNRLEEKIRSEAERYIDGYRETPDPYSVEVDRVIELLGLVTDGKFEAFLNHAEEYKEEVEGIAEQVHQTAESMGATFPMDQHEVWHETFPTQLVGEVEDFLDFREGGGQDFITKREMDEKVSDLLDGEHRVRYSMVRHGPSIEIGDHFLFLVENVDFDEVIEEGEVVFTREDWRAPEGGYESDVIEDPTRADLIRAANEACLRGGAIDGVFLEGVNLEGETEDGVKKMRMSFGS